MFSRITLTYITCAIVGVGLFACSSDKGSSPASVGSYGAGTGAGSGRSGTSAGNASTSGRGSAGRGLFGGQTCPMTEAEATGSCTPARGTCTFGERVCDCDGTAMTWACWSPGDCPTSVPAEQSSCGVVGMTCSPTRGANCRCTSTGWDCGNQYCPAAEPALGSACEAGTGLCTYGARKCDCDNSLWVCWNPTTDCPIAPPPDRLACTLAGAVCEYEGGSCKCNGMSGWRCGRGVMNDEDAGVPPSAGATALPVAGTAGIATAGGAGLTGAGSSGTAANSGTGAAGKSGAGAPAP
jgi:hypothetical protein